MNSDGWSEADLLCKIMKHNLVKTFSSNDVMILI